MWKSMLSAALCLFLFMTQSGRAHAAEPGDAGFYAVGSAQGISIEPLSPEGVPVAAESRDVDGDGWEEAFYPGSSALRVTVCDSAEGEMYLLQLRAAEGEPIFYADQKAGGGPLVFLLRFLLPAERTDLTLILSSTAGAVRIGLAYTPDAAGGEENPEPNGQEEPQEEPWEEPQEEPWEEPQEEPEPRWLTCPRDESCPMRAFTDLDPGAWYHDGIHFALEKGLMNGYDGGLFSPNQAASRAMLVSILWRMEGRPAAETELTFSDVDAGAWYGEAVRWAASEGIVSGYSAAEFGPNDPVTREQFAVILYRYIRMHGGGFADPEESLPGFSDADGISDWAFEAVCWMTVNGILKGVEGNLLLPRETATRAQIATMLMRCEALA